MLEADLPHEAGSSSELLSATHVFTVDIASAAEKPWVPQADGGLKRGVELELSVGELLKGTLPVPTGSPLRAEIFQGHADKDAWREGGTLWSERRLLVAEYAWDLEEEYPAEAGASYVILAEGDPASPLDVLMNEGACTRILPGAQRAEVHLARAAERVFRETCAEAASSGEQALVLASRALLGFATEHAAGLSGLFGRYLWARIGPSFVSSPERPVAELVALITSPAASSSVREVLVAALDPLLVALSGDTPFLRVVVDGYCRFLLENKPIERLVENWAVETSFHRLVFGRPSITDDSVRAYHEASVIVPAPADRERYAKALSQKSSSYCRTSHALAAWLGGP